MLLQFKNKKDIKMALNADTTIRDFIRKFFMHIVMLSSECSPIAKVGGLADVIMGLSKSLVEQGHRVEIILPKYDCMDYKKIEKLSIIYQDLPVVFDGQWHSNDIWSGTVDGVACYFIDAKWNKNYYNRNTIYGASDDTERFAYFSKAALEFLYKTNIVPDIIHTHDWPTALVNVLAREIYYHEGMTHPRLVYTVHNFGHQGLAHQSIIEKLGINPYKLSSECREDDFSIVNFMKAAILYSDYVSTVSPTYAKEVKYTDKGMGLQYLLNKYNYKFGGILNGIDNEYWNPKTDTYIPYHYDTESIQNKYKNKEALRQRLWLRDAYKPIVAVVSRLVGQKGVHLIKHSIGYSLSQSAQFVLLGSSPEYQISQEFSQIKNDLNDNPDCHLEFGFNEELSHLVYAGADIILVPSIFEPCGLTQLIGMRYGTVPVVRATGGLADTVIDIADNSMSLQYRNGYTFIDTDYNALEYALGRAIYNWFNDPELFRDIILNGMKYDFSWATSSRRYIDIYKFLHS